MTATRYGPLPDRLGAEDSLLLRRWTPDDAEALSLAVAESVDHLRPWMAWVAEEPISVPRRREIITRWEQVWSRGGDVLLGAWLGNRVAGGCGLHRRLGPGGLELGYWIHPAFLRRGLATEASRLLTDAALGLRGITHVEIHHDKANRASGGVPRRLGYEFVDERADEPVAPGEIGIEWRWRMTAEGWLARRP